MKRPTPMPEEPSFSVVSSAILWIRGTVFNLFINYNVEKEADLEAAISATREKLSKWIDAVESANGHSGLENFGDRFQTAMKGKMGKHIVWMVIGVFIAIFISLIKKNNKRAERDRDDNGESEAENCEQLYGNEDHDDDYDDGFDDDDE